MSKDNPFEITPDNVDEIETVSPEAGKGEPIDVKDPVVGETPKKAPKRRTKEEIHADELKAAQELLEAEGYTVNAGAEAVVKLPTYVDQSALPITSAAHNVVGEVVRKSGRSIVNLSKKFWVGEPPMALGLLELDDAISVLSDLREQVVATTEE